MKIVRSPEPGVGKPETRNSEPETRNPKPETNISIFASGAGSNAQKIIDYFRNHQSIKLSLIVCNNPEAGVLKIAVKEDIPSIIIEKEKFFLGNHYIDELKQNKIGFIVLAGFLWKLPAGLIQAFPNRIINIHPALLPNHGGKGMYGDKVHAAVIAAGEKESGITIHYVDELYDNGDIIFQAKCDVLPGDTPGTLAQRIHSLEHQYYPKCIEEVVGRLTS
jgi:phosphoribosylglycinamide formyltransferase-1